MRAALADVEGVEDVEVRFEKDEAVVRYRPDVADLDEMVEALEQAGYKSWPAAEERRQP